MSNTILTISEITRESMRILENNLQFTKGVNRQYDDAFAIKGAKIGSTLNLRLPARYVGRTGQVLNIENQTETYVPLTLGTQFGVDVQFTSADLELSMDDFSERYVTPAVAAVANKIDADGLALASQIYQAVGTPGTTPANLTPYLAAMAKLDFAAAPRDGMRSIVIDPNANATLVGALTTLFNPTDVVSKQYTDGNMGKAIGAKFSMDQNVSTHTSGPFSGTPLVNGANQVGASLITNGWASSAAAIMSIGDVFTVAGVFSVNPQTRLSTGQLQQFTVASTMVNDGSGNSTIAISPAIVTSGQFQNVTASPASSAAITVLGAASTASPMNILYHRDAFVLGSADLPLPKGVDMAARISDPKVGLSIRMVRAYDITNDLFPCRLDVLYGWSVPYPTLACRIAG